MAAQVLILLDLLDSVLLLLLPHVLPLLLLLLAVNLDLLRLLLPLVVERSVLVLDLEEPTHLPPLALDLSIQVEVAVGGVVHQGRIHLPSPANCAGLVQRTEVPGCLQAVSLLAWSLVLLDDALGNLVDVLYVRETGGRVLCGVRSLESLALRLLDMLLQAGAKVLGFFGQLLH